MMHIKVSQVCTKGHLFHHTFTRSPLRTLLKRVSRTLVAITAVPAVLTSPAIAEDISATFEKACAGVSQAPLVPPTESLCEGCHVGGGNVIGGPTLKLKDLEALGLTDIESLSPVIYAGNKRMPGFGEQCAPQVPPPVTSASHLSYLDLS